MKIWIYMILPHKTQTKVKHKWRCPYTILCIALLFRRVISIKRYSFIAAEYFFVKP